MVWLSREEGIFLLVRAAPMSRGTVSLAEAKWRIVGCVRSGILDLCARGYAMEEAWVDATKYTNANGAFSSSR